MTVFSEIYRTNAWNGVESRSGPGSGTAPTAAVAREIRELVDELGVQSVLDVGCGDSFWMPDLPGYVGMDVAPEAIELARARHPSRTYEVGNVRDGVRVFDLVIFRDALQHMPLADGREALRAIRQSGSRWLLASTYTDGTNIDVDAGYWYRPNLSVTPFDLGSAERLIFDGYDYADGHTARDPGKYLGLWP